jgi:type I restriction enzyme S subunit
MRENWGIKSLNDVCYFENGDRGKNYPSKKHYISEGFPFITAANVENGRILKNLNYISEERFNLLSRGKFKKNDFLFCLRGSLGKFGFVHNQLVGGIASSMVIVRTNSVIDDKWLHYYFVSDLCQKEIENRKGGAAQPNLGAKDLKKFEIPIPPLEEQKQIVAILDKAFTAIDQAKANIEKNIENAKELFQSKLNDIFSQKGDGWEEKSLGELGKVSMCKRILKKQTTPDGEIPFYKIGTFGKEPNAFISEEIYDDFRSKYSFPKKGDILLSASGTIGRRVIYNGEPAYFQDSNIVWIDNSEELVTNEYLYQFYGVCDFNPSKGATISRLYNDDLRKIKISFPSIEEQKLITPKMIKLSNQTLQIESNYKQKLEDLEELKKSILQKAFAGELTNKTVGV